MKNDLLMDFSIDRENKKINVKREFAAPVANVWAAWTESRLLDQWWAPKPWKSETKSMDFRPGGYWLYAMVGPEGEKHWARADFESITVLKRYSVKDAFCDEDGNINYSLPTAHWTNTFNEAAAGSTLVSIEIEYEKIEELEQIIQMGFKEGFTAGLENLDALLRG